MDSALAQFLAGPSPSEPATLDASQLENLVVHLTGERDQASVVRQREQVTRFVAGLRAYQLDPALEIRTLKYLLSQVQGQTLSFEDQIHAALERLAELYEGQSAWTDAAGALQGIPLESGHRNVPSLTKFRVYLRIAQLYLRANQATMAETYLNRAGLLVHDVKDDPAGQLQFRWAQARVLEAKCRFQEAYAKYYEISLASGGGNGADQPARALDQAITSAVVAGAGQQRTRALATLIKDERTRTSPHFALLHKMYLGRLLFPAEAVAIRSTLPPSLLAPIDATTPTTVFDEAVQEHNLLAASQVYSDLSLARAGELLGGISAIQTERLACRMITQGRLHAAIDRTAGFIYLDRPDSAAEFTQDRAITFEDTAIRQLCQRVEGVADALVVRYPQYGSTSTGED
ncbi:hypothetical protein IWQ60_007200 [Tieghemiomyces parasiticus]|uniref:COP9 signalosome complex subunit 4 n=1 Tax=Tieghemiomyces parasiticus TaxID=78921 RepID=A0A9W8A3X3_9FUNG|nr:hypothetical protein IWQ60_007200 [Tieghemiomyces parasiticus]